MPLPPLVLLYLGGLACLTPVAAYLLWVGSYARRPRPTVVSGPWDFAALLLGLSGFVLFGGTVVLALVRSNVRLGARGNFNAVKAAWEHEWLSWLLVVGAYLAAVVGTAAWGLFARRRALVVYNVAPADFEHALSDVFDQIGQKVERRGNGWFAGPEVCRLDPFPAGRTVTLRWTGDDPHLFEEVERQLRQSLPGLPPADENPAARWITAAAGACITANFVCLVLLLLTLLLVR